MQSTTSTELDNRKMLMWAFLGSDVLFFGTLIATHLVYRGQSLVGHQEDIFSIPVTSVSTFVLLMSSLAMVLALAAIQRGGLQTMRFWIAVTAVLGAIFVGFQMFEFHEFVQAGLTPRTNLFGSTFFTMTGFHGAHVTIGVLWLWSIFFASFKWEAAERYSLNMELAGLYREARERNRLNVEIAGLYWHFVDIVWVVIFGVVYLVGAYGAEDRILAPVSGLGG